MTNHVTYVEVQDSSYLDLTSYETNVLLPLPTVTRPLTNDTAFNVALVFDRANPLPDLLNVDWASRQTQIEQLNQSGTLWQTYGADPQKFTDAVDALSALGFTPFPSTVNGQYVTSPESRTIWVTVNQDNFEKLFGTKLLEATVLVPEVVNLPIYWEGNLSLPQELVDAGVVGLWFDQGELAGSNAAILADPGLPDQTVTLPEGAQSPGNSAPENFPEDAKYPNEIAELYNFPFADPDLWQSVETGKIGLIEPGQGDALPQGSDSFDDLLEEYREGAGITEALKPTISISAGGQEPPAQTTDERSLDVGIATTVNPSSQLVLYAGSGNENNADANGLTAYQSAIWDTANNPQVVSSSFSTFNNIHPDSPLYTTMQMLYEDAVLRNITMVNAAGDGGSGAKYANGLTNVEINHASALSLAVGGASLSTGSRAEADPTLKTIYDNAIHGDPATVWQLVSGGLTVLPSKAKSDHVLIETAWNAYVLEDNKDILYSENLSGAGGVDTSQPTPSYQTAFGLDPITSDPRAATGRGIPDVAAVSGGNMKYIVPTSNFVKSDKWPLGIQSEAGTSGAAPLWASLISQIDAIFADQNLPQLGFMNDLLYTAAVIAPASFNDITLGTNTSSYVLGGPYDTSGVALTPTGYGYSAGLGYDLTTGLGTPNGVLLARAMTWVAHSQMSFPDSPEVLSADANGWISPVNQSLLIQVSAPDFTTVNVQADGEAKNIVTAGSDSFAWTSRFAEQVLQPDFDRALVRMFDHQSQGALVEQDVRASDQIAVVIDAVSATAPQGTLSTDFGFVDFVSDDGSQVRIARPVAVAETVDGLDDQVAVVRMRQAGEGDYVLKTYRVDDFDGTIDGLRPGDCGYNAAADERAYETISGKTGIKGPGYLNYQETKIVGVDAGDLVAMKLTHGDQTYFAFAEANETSGGDPVAHLWNYGFNTWGWEGGYKGGDMDFNDLVVQLDFTSAYGSGWLATEPDDKPYGGHGKQWQQDYRHKGGDGDGHDLWRGCEDAKRHWREDDPWQKWQQDYRHKVGDGDGDELWRGSEGAKRHWREDDPWQKWKQDYRHKGGDGEGDRIKGIENLSGSSQSDELTGNNLDNRLLGEAGDCPLNGRAGDDVPYGGPGNDFQPVDDASGTFWGGGLTVFEDGLLVV